MKSFYNHTAEATKNDVGMFNPICRLNIPKYPYMPRKTLRNSTQIKKNCALGLQTEAMQGVIFGIELILLESFELLLDQILLKCNDKVQAKTDFKFFYFTMFLFAKTNYLKEGNLKEIKWQTKPCRVKDSEPRWRSENGPIPKTIPNKYAQKLSDQVREWKHRLDAVSILNNYNALLKPKPSTSVPISPEITVSTASNNKPKVRNVENSRVGAKEQSKSTRKVGLRRRAPNPNFNQNRDLINLRNNHSNSSSLDLAKLIE